MAIRNAYVGMPVRYVSPVIAWAFDSKVTEVAPEGDRVRVDCGGVPLVFA